MTYDYTTLKPDYDKLIDGMDIPDEYTARIDAIARRIIKHKEQYQQVSDALAPKDNSRRIPWQFIGAIHYRESDFSFTKHLHNGDSLSDRTVHVPAGRPDIGDPPFTWVESACDALEMKGLQRITDWPLSRIAYELERYNGFGYRNHGISDPYLWSGTNNYNKGKYVSDGNLDPEAVDKQMGTMPIISRVAALDVDHSAISLGSRKLTWIKRTKAALVTTVGGYLTADNFNAIPGYVSNYKALGLPIYVWGVAALGALVWVVFSIIENLTVQDYKNGTYTPSNLTENKVDSTTNLTK